jgi:hypothetical protein
MEFTNSGMMAYNGLFWIAYKLIVGAWQWSVPLVAVLLVLHNELDGNLSNQ